MKTGKLKRKNQDIDNYENILTMNTFHIGKIGEDVLIKYLKTKGYQILDRNYKKKWGELDIVAKKDEVIHFIEVKTGVLARENVSRENVSRENAINDIRPEDSITACKRKQLRRIIQTYIFDRKIPEEQEFQIDAGIVLIDFHVKKAKIRIIEDILA